MGKYKDLMIEFDESHDDMEHNSDKYFFVFDLWIKCRLSRCISMKAELKRFFNDVFPALGRNECIWCMASSSEGISYNFSYGDREQALRDLSILADKNVNLYFSPALFTGWRTDRNVSRINTIYIDIDDIEGMDFSRIDESRIKNWLCEVYHLTEEVLPNWVVASGHGLHLYWLVGEIDLTSGQGTDLRKQYTDYLITYFKADIACRNKSRILRFPNSRNVKDINNIKITRLFHINKSKDRGIIRLDFFRCSNEAVDTYVSENIKRRSEKRKATMIKNGTWRERKDKAEKATKGPQISKRPLTKGRQKKSGIKYDIPDEVSQSRGRDTRTGTVIKELIQEPLSPKRRYLRIIRDLQNYAIRRYTVPQGYRAIFCHILAVYCKKARFSIEDVEAILYDCIDNGFINEADQILQSVYQSQTDYTYTNERIAELLNFQSCDLEKSYACYTEGQREERRKRALKRYDNKRYGDSRKRKTELKQRRMEFIKEHSNMTAKELAEALDCSERTIRYIKADMKQDS